MSDQENSQIANLQGQVAVQVGHGLVMDSLHALDLQRQQTELDSLRAQVNSRPAPIPSSSGDSPELLYKYATVKRELAESKELLDLKNDEVAVKVQEVANLMAAVKQRDDVIVEWMHSNEALKRLSREYAKKIGLSDEQRMLDFKQQIIDAADENGCYKGTRLLAKILAENAFRS